MFAEVSLRGQIVDRVWRYGDSLRFFLSTRRALPGAVPDPAQTHLIDVPIGVTRALAVGRLTVGMNVYVQARLVQHERVETLAQFLKQATGPKLDTREIVAVHQVRNHRTQTEMLAQSIVVGRRGRDADRPYAEANLRGRIADRIWTHDNQLHFRLLVNQESSEHAAPNHLDFFTIILPTQVTRLLPMKIQPGMLVSVQAIPVTRDHTETLATFLRTSPDGGLFPAPPTAGQIVVQRRKVDFLAKMVVIREMEKRRRPAVRPAVKVTVLPRATSPQSNPAAAGAPIDAALLAALPMGDEPESPVGNAAEA